MTALTLSRDHSSDQAAAALTEALRVHYPDNAFIAVYSASVFENIGMLDKALAETYRSITLAGAQKLDLNELQMVNLTARRDRRESTRKRQAD